MNIRCSNISLNFDDVEILKDVSFATNDKKFIGIIGPNGSGKSTFLKCIYNYLIPTSGSIYIDNTCITDLSLSSISKMVSVVAQQSCNNFEFRVREMVLMGRYPYKGLFEGDTEEDFSIVSAALQKVGMQHMQDRNFSSLSGGEKQRVLLARAFAQKASCIILDEPTNHLDIKYQLEILDIVYALDITVICAIHDLSIAMMYCDYIYALNNGRVVCVGGSEDVITESFIKDVYGVDAKILKDGEACSIVYKPLHIRGNNIGR